jgi:hypothetical protein
LLPSLITSPSSFGFLAADLHFDDLSPVLVDLVVLLPVDSDQAQTEFDPMWLNRMW